MATVTSVTKLADYMEVLQYCRFHKPIMQHRNRQIYIHGIENHANEKALYLSQIVGNRAFFMKTEYEDDSDAIVLKIRDGSGFAQTCALFLKDFVHMGEMKKTLLKLE